MILYNIINFNINNLFIKYTIIYFNLLAFIFQIYLKLLKIYISMNNKYINIYIK